MRPHNLGTVFDASAVVFNRAGTPVAYSVDTPNAIAAMFLLHPSAVTVQGRLSGAGSRTDADTASRIKMLEHPAASDMLAYLTANIKVR